MDTADVMGMARPAPMGIDYQKAIEAAGAALVRYGLALVLLWIGAMKFTAYEAEGIRPFVENSPLLSWAYGVFGIQGFSNFLGVAEIAIALMIASRAVAPKVSAAGGLLAAGTFVMTLSFLVTTGGAWLDGGVLALSVPGQFLIKDVVLLGAALWGAAEAWKASKGCAMCGG
jgi:uncharacterized membrane protein YkgB